MASLPGRHPRPRRIAGLVECELPDELLLHRPGGSQVLSLNATARAVWERCDGRRSVETIACDLARHFPEPPDEILAAVRHVIQQMADLGLIVLSGPAESDGVAEPES